MNSINFNNVSVLSYSHNPKFFGNNIFDYSIEKTFSVEGYLLDLQNFAGVSGVLSGINDVKNLAKQNAKFYINDLFLGTGYINNIKVDGNQKDPNWVRYANYVAEVIVLSTGSLRQATGSFYDLDDSKFNVQNLYLINDFKENFSTSLSPEGIYEYNHEVSLEFENGIDKEKAQNTAKILASGIISNEVPFNILSPYNNFLSGKKLYKESYDLINNKFNFVETFSKSKSGDIADALYNYNINLNQEGDVTVSENIKIQSLSLPYFETSINKLNSLKNDSYLRCQQLYFDYYGNTGQLNQNFVEQGFIVNKFNGQIEFQTIFSNDAFIESGYQWELSSDVDDKEDRVSVSVILLIEGFGPINSNQKWNNTINGYNIKKSLIDRNYASQIYNGLDRSCKISFSSINNKINERHESSYANGTIKSSIVWSDILRTSVESTSNQPPVNQYNFITSANMVTTAIAKTVGRAGFSIRKMGDSAGSFSMPYGALLESDETSKDLVNNITERKVSYIY